VLAASAYDAGGKLARRSKDSNGSVPPEEVWFSRDMLKHHGGVVLVDDCLYDANGKLYVRDQDVLPCYDVKAE